MSHGWACKYDKLESENARLREALLPFGTLLRHVSDAGLTASEQPWNPAIPGHHLLAARLACVPRQVSHPEASVCEGSTESKGTPGTDKSPCGSGDVLGSGVTQPTAQDSQHSSPAPNISSQHSDPRHCFDHGTILDPEVSATCPECHPKATAQAIGQNKPELVTDICFNHPRLGMRCACPKCAGQDTQAARRSSNVEQPSHTGKDDGSSPSAAKNTAQDTWVCPTWKDPKCGKGEGVSK